MWRSASLCHAMRMKLTSVYATYASARVQRNCAHPPNRPGLADHHKTSELSTRNGGDGTSIDQIADGKPFMILERCENQSLTLDASGRGKQRFSTHAKPEASDLLLQAIILHKTCG